MSKYTTEIRFICENAAGLNESEGFNSLDEILEKARPKIFNFPYPIFDENYRSVLENKILIRNYTKEICCETVGRWKLFLRDRLNTIMPYYNQLYESELLKFNPLYDTDLTEKRNTAGNENFDENSSHKDNTEELRTGKHTLDRTVDDTGNDSRNGSSTDSGHDDYTNNDDFKDTTVLDGHKKVVGTHQDAAGSDTLDKSDVDKMDYFSDTPQGSTDGVIGLDYLTNVRHNVDKVRNSTVVNGSSNGNTTENTDDDNTTTVTHDGSIHHAGAFSNTGTTTDAGEFTEKHTTDEDGTTQNNLNSQQIGTANRNSLLQSTENYLSHVQGKSGGASYSKLLMEYRETFLNIDNMILNELDDLFFGLW